MGVQLLRDLFEYSVISCRVGCCSKRFSSITDLADTGEETPAVARATVMARAIEVWRFMVPLL